MGAIDKFLGRMGYARLDRYGLILTTEGRVMSNRPAVLDDGLGGRIVGWLEGDLAALELDHWGQKLERWEAPTPKLSGAKPSAAKPSAPPIPRAAAAPAPSRMPTQAPIAATSPTVATPVVAAPKVEEDEWEWEIAVARARAAAEEVEQARVDLLGASAVIATPAMPTRTTRPGIAAVAAKDEDGWPTTQPLADSWSGQETKEAPRVMSPLEKSMALAKSMPARKAKTQPTPVVTAPAKTVIPVPQLPVAARPSDVRPAPHTPSQPRRFARGTGPHIGQSDDTVTKIGPPPQHREDRTSPYITLPSEVKPHGYAHTKRVAAKQR